MNKIQLASISSSDLIEAKLEEEHRSGFANCPSCGRKLEGKQEWLGLPAGVKFDPTDQELIEHLEAKVVVEAPPHEGIMKSHPLIDEFIPTIDGEDGICYTHPENLPGVTKDGLSRHFFHRPSRAYTTGTRKRRKIQTENDEVQTGSSGGETRWHKTGKTRPVMSSGNQKGCKKILVLYTNFGKNRKPEKTNWVMHQYHLGQHEEEKDGELVVSKIFYQTQPRQSSWSSDRSSAAIGERNINNNIISLHHQIPNNNNNNLNSEYSNRRDSSSGSFASKEVITQQRGGDDQLSGAYGNMDMQQINSDRFGFDPFGKGFNELQEEMGKAASGSGTTAAEHGIVEHLQIQSQHDAQRQHHHPQLTNISMPSHPVSSSIMPPDPLHHTSIILNQDPYHLSELMLQNQTFQQPRQEHHKLVGSTSTLEDLIMGCTSTDKKAESSSSMAIPQDAEWFKYSSFWPDPDNPNQHG